MIKEIKLDNDDKCEGCLFFFSCFICTLYDTYIKKHNRLKKCKSDELKLLKRLGG